MPSIYTHLVELPIVNRKVCKDWNRDLKARMIGAGLQKGGKPVCEGMMYKSYWRSFNISYINLEFIAFAIDAYCF